MALSDTATGATEGLWAEALPRLRWFVLFFAVALGVAGLADLLLLTVVQAAAAGVVVAWPWTLSVALASTLLFAALRWASWPPRVLASLAYADLFLVCLYLTVTELHFFRWPP